MFHIRPLLHLNKLSSTPKIKCYLHLLKPHSFNFLSTTTTTTTISDSDKNSFTISYLTNNCGISPQEALKASKRINFNTPKKPNFVIAFFKTHGFSDDQIQSIICRNPQLILSNPIKTLLPKFQFLASKGASPTDIVATVTGSPHFLRSSLKRIIQTFELVRSFCPSDQKAITSIIFCPSFVCDSRMKPNPIIFCPSFVCDSRMKPNLQFLIDFGVTRSCIYRLLCSRPSVLCSNDLRKAITSIIKELGFHPSKISFGVALLAKRAITKSQWDAKVDTLKSWGYSEDAIFNAFKRNPKIMLQSADKLNAVVSFWIKQLEWDPSVLLAAPDLFSFSLEKRLVPRASVVWYLLSKGLIKKSASLYTPFNLSDVLFMKKYVSCYEEEEASRLLRLYQGKDASI
ncbi:transcription termination factor MTERF4, chloroplastic-like [Vicia villosa]|uniref:transcription termination factor MTERF4, chloroplastic-like n=1 Tax=Vicia villosa TaxID=3911 RepID=UPI00273A9E31|nr:transcription termination factor MTERF4, chloroplastic-like [Vicia villosa]